jgi:thiol-disulfide isomerase/thioredoxin
MKRFQHVTRLLLFLLAGIALTACGSAFAQSGGSGKQRGFSLHKTPQTVPAFVFQDGDGKRVRTSDLRGKVIVLNLWATWCAPCREEMPTLDRLQAQLGGKDFEVIALSVDQSGPPIVRKFFDQINVKNLRLYVDTTSDVLEKLKVPGLPVTLLLDRNGRELGRLVGTTRWDSPEMVEFLQSVIGSSKADRTVAAPSALQTVAAE